MNSIDCDFGLKDRLFDGTVKISDLVIFVPKLPLCIPGEWSWKMKTDEIIDGFISCSQNWLNIFLRLFKKIGKMLANTIILIISGEITLNVTLWRRSKEFSTIQLLKILSYINVHSFMSVNCDLSRRMFAIWIKICKKR